MPDAPDCLMPASADDLADALAFALRFEGRKRRHDAGEMMARIVAKRLIDHLERSGFVVMKRPPIEGGAALGQGFKG
jgi:hypothetical protein